MANKQMDLFDEGGLMQEGGTVDPVSGNDVPVGSTQEEVRDDIPAQLSEGEFVMPADVVRYHGLDKMMALRDEAKMGLARMEAMGQMGNSEEATIPDGVPFNMDDLDMDYDEGPMEMQVGGYVPNQQQPYGIYQQPPGYGTGTVPSQFAQYSQTIQPASQFQPFGGGQPQQTQGAQGYLPAFYNVPQMTGTQPGYTFGQLMPTVGGVSETREYRNDAGQVLYIPFVNGQPVYPIPEGYTEYVPEEVAAEQPREEDVRLGTTQITEGGGREDDTPRTGYITISDPSNEKTGQKTLGIEVGTGARGQPTIGTEDFLGLGLDTTQPGPVFDLVDTSTGARVGLTPEEANILNASGIQSGSLKAQTDFKTSGLPTGLEDAMDRLSFQNDIKSVENTKAFNDLTDKLGLPSTRQLGIADVLKPGGLITAVINDVTKAFDKGAKAEEAASRALAVDIANAANNAGTSFEDMANQVSAYLDDPTVTGTKTAAEAAATPVFAPNPQTGKLEQVSGKPTSAPTQAAKSQASVSTASGMSKEDRIAMTANSLMDLGMNATDAYNAAVGAETTGKVDPYTAAAFGQPTVTEASYSPPSRDTGRPDDSEPSAPSGPSVGYGAGQVDPGLASAAAAATGVGVGRGEDSPSAARDASKDSDGGNGGGDKIICTAMNNAYGFGSFRQAVWLQHSKTLDPAYQIGYHTIFKPVVKWMYSKDTIATRLVRWWGEGFARRRTADIWLQKHGKRHTLGRIERAFWEPLCYCVGKLKQWNWI